MAATQNDIREWLTQGNGATHVIIVCDTFSYEDYPVYVQPGEPIREQIAKYDEVNMQKVMEVYNLALPLEPQLNRQRVWNL